MSGCFHFSPDRIADEAMEVASLGIPAVLLFGLPEQKDPQGSQAYSDDATVCRAIRQIKEAVPELLVKLGMALGMFIPGTAIGMDQIRNLSLDNITEDRTSDNYIKPMTVDSWIKENL